MFPQVGRLAHNSEVRGRILKQPLSQQHIKVMKAMHFAALSSCQQFSPHTTLKLLGGKKSADRHLWHVDTEKMFILVAPRCVWENQNQQSDGNLKGNIKWVTSAAGL